MFLFNDWSFWRMRILQGNLLGLFSTLIFGSVFSDYVVFHVNYEVAVIVNIQESDLSGMLFTVGILMRIKLFVGSEVICDEGFNDKFYYFKNERHVRDWTVVRNDGDDGPSLSNSEDSGIVSNKERSK